METSKELKDAKQKPEVGNSMVPFHRNRNATGACRGGVAIFIAKELAHQCVVLDRAAEDEMIAVKMNCFSTPLVVVAVYGAQETGPREKIKEQWRRIFTLMEKYRDEGNQVVMGGDLNAWVGESFGLIGNDPKLSAGGKDLTKLMIEGGWKMMNSKSQEDPRTHMDRRQELSIVWIT